ncbi:MAG: LL-diaminopimelate aminotransferase [Gammaproteobacteria bacterium]|jgi:LL-diaminopimelate aminotransferase|nr:LL-diaminopimelate aminotransferase [Gammaproteobacteria bacterium]MBT3490101.1 LL-diaminopimelate aminotransferase [Gammaproteobacteria bacterium]MBT3718591.1 LL-diaminopimelate aminotransferase [Gammaproteobacteria bacterium]MBT3844377.1 LL-diaminopimelate aminotransferase [Gammaproteobacteria bacterium]MBT3892574.1 LL-diaminopimelate aminotransferase [Gammaproteobacteria bacterium]
MDSYIQQLFAERIGGSQFGKDTNIYKFEKIKRAKRAAMEANPETEMIDMGVGEPDWMAEPEVVEVLCQEAKKWENRGYTDNGIDAFKEAAASYMDRVFGVSGLNANSEINHGIGSKPVLALLPMAFINPGDITIMTTPGYPLLGTTTEAVGGEVVSLPLLEENDFLPDLDLLTDDQKTRAKLLCLNYPNNPTGAVATEAFYKKAIAFAKENGVVIVSDEAYAALTFGEERPLSFLNVEGAKEVGIAIQSLSKAYNMTGWRLAFVAGNELVVKAFAAIKDNNDSGQFAAIQQAGVYCLNHPEITEKTSAKYSRRHDLLVDALRSAGFEISKPKATFYLYVKAPRGTKSGATFESGEAFSQYLIKEKMISTVPWDDAGNFIRFSVTFVAKNEADEERVISEIKQRLGEGEFIFD